MTPSSLITFRSVIEQFNETVKVEDQAFLRLFRPLVDYLPTHHWVEDLEMRWFAALPAGQVGNDAQWLKFAHEGKFTGELVVPLKAVSALRTDQHATVQGFTPVGGGSVWGCPMRDGKPFDKLLLLGDTGLSDDGWRAFAGFYVSAMDTLRAMGGNWAQMVAECERIVAIATARQIATHQQAVRFVESAVAARQLSSSVPAAAKDEPNERGRLGLQLRMAAITQALIQELPTTAQVKYRDSRGGELSPTLISELIAPTFAVLGTHPGEKGTNALGMETFKKDLLAGFAKLRKLKRE